MKPYPVDPQTALHVARRIQRGRPRVEFRNKWTLAAIYCFALGFWIALAVVVINYTKHNP